MIPIIIGGAAIGIAGLYGWCELDVYAQTKGIEARGYFDAIFPEYKMTSSRPSLSFPLATSRQRRFRASG